jgi:ABC-2 type transport system permease protein
MTARLALLYLRVHLLNEVQYRANFLLRLVHSALALGTGLIALALVFRQVDRLDGWDANQLLVLMGVYTMLNGFAQMIVVPNALKLLTDIEEGTLDLVLLKPADAQLAVSLRATQIWQGLDVLTGAGTIVTGLVLAGGVRPLVLLDFLVAIACGGALVYSLLMSITISAFWFVKLDNVGELFSGVFQTARWPVGIYPGWLRVVLSFLVPVGLAVTVPAEVLTSRPAGPELVMMIALAVASLAATRSLWRRGLRRYSGASA